MKKKAASQIPGTRTRLKNSHWVCASLTSPLSATHHTAASGGSQHVSPNITPWGLWSPTYTCSWHVTGLTALASDDSSRHKCTANLAILIWQPRQHSQWKELADNNNHFTSPEMPTHNSHKAIQGVWMTTAAVRGSFTPDPPIATDSNVHLPTTHTYAFPTVRKLRTHSHSIRGSLGEWLVYKEWYWR